MVYRFGLFNNSCQAREYKLSFAAREGAIECPARKKEIRHRNSTSLVRINPFRGIDFQSLGEWPRNLISKSYFFLSLVQSLLFPSLINIPSLSRFGSIMPESPLFVGALTPAALVFARVLEEHEDVQRCGWSLLNTSPRFNEYTTRTPWSKRHSKKISSWTSILSP